MKYQVLLLNYDSNWVVYCDAAPKFYAEEARADLLRHGFQDHQIKLQPL